MAPEKVGARHIGWSDRACSFDLVGRSVLFSVDRNAPQAPEQCRTSLGTSLQTLKGIGPGEPCSGPSARLSGGRGPPAITVLWLELQCVATLQPRWGLYRQHSQCL
jgi:hypothetical protein